MFRLAFPALTSRNKGKILVIRGGAIGDFILTLPVLSALRGQFPQTHLEVLGYPHIAQLALAGGLADRVQSIEARALAGFFARGGVLDPVLAEYFAEFSLVISYLYDPDEIFKSNLARCSKAQLIVGPHRPPENGTRHAAEVFLQPLERLAIFNADPQPRLALAESNLATSKPEETGRPQLPNPESPCLAVHPGSGSEQKNWPEEKWARLLPHLSETTALQFLIIGGEAEGDRVNRLANQLSQERVRMAQSLPLSDLARLLARCHLFVGHDSGITHLAAAVGLKGLALWGDTNEKVWRPLSPLIKLVRHPAGLAALDVEEVVQQLRLTERPCA